MNQLQPLLIQELTPLRKGRGITPLKLQDMPTIRSIVARVTSTPHANLTNNQVLNFLFSELSVLPSDNSITALKYALGIDSTLSRLSARRLSLAATLDKHPDTIERYENQGIGQFAAHLTERALLSQAKDTSPHFSPSYLDEMEMQAKATRAMTTIGLASHLSLPSHSDDLMRYLEMPRKPYIDATVHIVLLPSSRGVDWYRFRLSYTFSGVRESFRIAVVLDNSDGEQLLTNGLVDDYHRLDNPDNPSRDIKTIIASSKFVIKNSAKGTQKLLRFHEVGSARALRVFESSSKPLSSPCWLLETSILPQWQTQDCTYEYHSWINLQIASVAYWYSPTLMYLKKLSLDFSQFPEAHKRDFFLLPFLGHAPGTILEEKYLYILNLNNWIMPGHGIVLGWQDTVSS